MLSYQCRLMQNAANPTLMVIKWEMRSTRHCSLLLHTILTFTTSLLHLLLWRLLLRTILTLMMIPWCSLPLPRRLNSMTWRLWRWLQPYESWGWWTSQPVQVEGVILKKDGQKSDDAPIPTQIWENHFRDTLPPEWPNPIDPSNPGRVYPLHPMWREWLESYREWGIRLWRRNVHRTFWTWLKAKFFPKLCAQLSRTITYVTLVGRSYQWTRKGQGRYQQDMLDLLNHPKTRKDWDPARECVFKANSCDWWDLRQGSRPFFWCWPSVFVAWARDGQSHYQTHEFPRFTKLQQAPKTPADQVMCWQKLYKVRERLYIDVGLVLSLMHMFYVPKGDSDIQMVYNGAASGIGNQ